MKIGFIGLGIMGTPMANNLLNAGHEMFVRTRSKVPAALQAAHVCATNADVARAAEIRLPPGSLGGLAGGIFGAVAAPVLLLADLTPGSDFYGRVRAPALGD